jgi:hypothetical protein
LIVPSGCSAPDRDTGATCGGRLLQSETSHQKRTAPAPHRNLQRLSLPEGLSHSALHDTCSARDTDAPNIRHHGLAKDVLDIVDLNNKPRSGNIAVHVIHVATRGFPLLTGLSVRRITLSRRLTDIDSPILFGVLPKASTTPRNQSCDPWLRRTFAPPLVRLSISRAPPAIIIARPSIHDSTELNGLSKIYLHPQASHLNVSGSFRHGYSQTGRPAVGGWVPVPLGLFVGGAHSAPSQRAKTSPGTSRLERHAPEHTLAHQHPRTLRPTFRCPCATRVGRQLRHGDVAEELEVDGCTGEPITRACESFTRR